MSSGSYVPVVALYTKSETTANALINLKCVAPDGAEIKSAGLNGATVKSTLSLPAEWVTSYGALNTPLKESFVELKA